MSIVRMFPADWLTDVIVLRGGGRDPRGNPLPTEEIPVSDCLIGPRATSEGEQFMVTSTDMALYRDPDPEFSFRSTARIWCPRAQERAAQWSERGGPLSTRRA